MHWGDLCSLPSLSGFRAQKQIGLVVAPPIRNLSVWWFREMELMA